MDVGNVRDGYWLEFLDARRSFLEAIVDRADQAPAYIKKQMLLSLEKALRCSAVIGPELLERYTLLWRQDLRNWQERVAEIREMSCPDAALEELGLSRSA